MGIYYKLPGFASNQMPVWRRSGAGTEYLFWWPASSAWLMGPDYKSASAGLFKATDLGTCPNEISGADWNYAGSSAWLQGTLSVQCSSGKPDTYILFNM